jgi:hypothetical protein
MMLKIFSGGPIFVIYACVCGYNFLVKENDMTKGKGSSGGHLAPRGGKGGVGFIPSVPGGGKPSMTEKPSGDGRGNLPPKNGK